MSQKSQPESIGHLLAQICRLSHCRIQNLVGEIGLHRGQPYVLKVLWEEEGLTHTELANRLHVRPATVTNTVKRMEKAGFLERRPDENDQRVSRVYLTDSGREIQGEVKQTLREFEAQVLAGFSPEERALLGRFLLQIHDNLLQLNGDCSPR